MKRELIVTADGRDRTVVVEGPLPDGRFRVTLDGQSARGRCARDPPGHLVDHARWPELHRRSRQAPRRDRRVGRRERGDAPGRGRAAPPARAAAASPRSAARGESIRAPIAGKVVKVLVAVGDTVAPGSAGHRPRGDEDGERARLRARRHRRRGPQAGRTGRRYRRPARRADLSLRQPRTPGSAKCPRRVAATVASCPGHRTSHATGARRCRHLTVTGI